MTKREFAPFTASSNARHSLVTWFGQADKFRISTKDSRNAAVVKPMSGVLIGWYLVNRTVGERFVLFYDQKTEPTSDDKIDWVLTLRPDDASTAEFVLQIPFFAGIAFTITASKGIVKAGDVEGVLLYA